MKKIGLGLLCVLTHSIFSWAFASDPANNNDSCYPLVSQSFQRTTVVPVAVNDTFLLATGCSNNMVSGNLLLNDNYDPDDSWLSRIEGPKTGNFSCGPLGNFVFTTDPDFQGEIVLKYRLSSISDPDSYSCAYLVIYVENDADCDQVVNSIDIDDDNDGILDVHEGDESVDTDGDGIPDCFDIDSDNDGITDFTEWQTEGYCKPLLLIDENGDGWDAAFDPDEGGDYYEQVDTDMDGIPDFQDYDSDGDGISDYIEAFDTNNDQVAELDFSNMDFDSDGLDNSCDTVNCALSRFNPMGSNSPLPDNDQNDIRDWRDPYNYIYIENPLYAKTGEDELFVYPNPVVDKCTLVLPENENTVTASNWLKIFDMKGSLQYMESFEGNVHELSLAHLKKGIYIVRIKAGTKELVTRISKAD
ncbi:T9SS type A sorting domain-containing protein [Draconibacterium sp. IB214405]|uniref:T9SS type A sorting domain-containing protein n=1 Tax=Draconibacterium sp. IB214405 TaxID=3097352 RepID=UPI002A126B72|nr:T9SS type A sorting domain-containing protein [Draconibacterium sp. IB214405]MDX8339339.1 T9SS type A sorting domain-containing protein [Draconibacterium sp. IB214405]